MQNQFALLSSITSGVASARFGVHVLAAVTKHFTAKCELLTDSAELRSMLSVVLGPLSARPADSVRIETVSIKSLRTIRDMIDFCGRVPNDGFASIRIWQRHIPCLERDRHVNVDRYVDEQGIISAVEEVYAQREVKPNMIIQNQKQLTIAALQLLLFSAHLEHTSAFALAAALLEAITKVHVIGRDANGTWLVVTA